MKLENAKHLWVNGLFLMAMIVAPVLACAGAQRPTLAVLPFEINDTSGEVGASGRHDEMLSRLTTFISEKLTAAHLYDVVPAEHVAGAIKEINPGTYLRACNGCEFDIARRAGADLVMIGWFWKVSTLVGTLHIEIKDVATGRTIYQRVFDFRGDNDKAWERAASYMVGTLKAPGT